MVIRLSTGAEWRTDAGGWYGFYNLAPGTYTITEIQPAGYTSTTPDVLTVTVAAGEISLHRDFGDLRLPALTRTATPTGGAPLGRLLLSEVYYDAVQPGTDTAYEWVELHAADGAGRSDRLEAARQHRRGYNPPFTLQPGEFLVIAATADGFAANFPGFTGHLVALGGSIGSGLSNTGDRVL